MHCLEFGDLRAAVGAPGRPEYKHYGLSTEVAQSDRLALDVIQFEIRHGLPCRDEFRGIFEVLVDGLAGSSPGLVSAEQIADLVSCLAQCLCCGGTAAPATAIHIEGLLAVELRIYPG